MVDAGTDDAEGEVVSTRPVPALTDAAIEAALCTLRGRITQTQMAERMALIQGTTDDAALANADVQRYTEGKPPKKVVVVPGRLVNVVV